jgi:hypothetical protein
MCTGLPKVTALVMTMVFVLAIQSCSSPALDHPTQVSPLTPTLLVETPSCTEKTILPRITDIQPSPITAGSEITITGTGGYIQDSCGGINESARSFKLYLDKELVGDLLCYVNHCETKINVAETISSGSHCLSTQKDICEFQFQVASK